MITIADTLETEHVLLDLTASTMEDAVRQLVNALRDDERVLDWKEFAAALTGSPHCRVGEGADFGICVPHARTDSVNSMVMSAGRLTKPLNIRECPRPIRYIFCLGIPKAVASEYLRIAGALMRIFTDPETEEALRATTTRDEFVAALARLEVKLQ